MNKEEISELAEIIKELDKAYDKLIDYFLEKSLELDHEKMKKGEKLKNDC